jgi:hypothetical protein
MDGVAGGADGGGVMALQQGMASRLMLRRRRG